jgi:predicted dehydrogenase
MKNDSARPQPGPQDLNEQSQSLPRRKFISMVGASAAAFTILPRHVLGRGYIAPSDQVNLAYIGLGTQGIRELLPLIQNTGFRVIAVCDPNQHAVGYRDWDKLSLKMNIRQTIKNMDWESGGDNLIPGGRDNGKSIVDQFYANVHPELNYKGCNAYEDFRVLFDKEKDIDAVKIMTPDHLHGLISMAAIRRSKHVIVHKPLSNRLIEGKKVIQAARDNQKVITHLVPWDSNGSMETVMAWIGSGAIGTLKEIHNWTQRPVWPQYSSLPTDNPAIPDGLNWDLWIGPETMRNYNSNYTNMVFRGWYDFGGGSMADMGHYSLWTVFKALQLTSPHTIIPNLSHVCAMNEPLPYRIQNNFSFPMASHVCFKYPANGNRPAVDLWWYDGGMRPAIPEELLSDNKQLAEEGMLFVGDQGKILAGFNVQDPKIISGTKMDSPVQMASVKRSQVEQTSTALPLFIDAIKNSKQYPGNIIEAEFLTEAVNLYAASLRSGKLLKYDAGNRRITNVDDANRWLDREYRSGWDIASI